MSSVPGGLADGGLRERQHGAGRQIESQRFEPNRAYVPHHARLLDRAVRAGEIVQHQAGDEPGGVGLQNVNRLLAVEEQFRRVLGEPFEDRAVAGRQQGNALPTRHHVGQLPRRRPHLPGRVVAQRHGPAGGNRAGDRPLPVRQESAANTGCRTRRAISEARGRRRHGAVLSAARLENKFRRSSVAGVGAARPANASGGLGPAVTQRVQLGRRLANDVVDRRRKMSQQRLGPVGVALVHRTNEFKAGGMGQGRSHEPLIGRCRVRR